MESIPQKPSRERHKTYFEKARHLIFAVTTVFAALMPEGVEAVEFKDTSWHGGLNTIADQVTDSFNEHMGLAIHVPGKVTKWINGREGSMDNTGSGHEKIDETRYLIDSISVQLESAKHKQDVVSVCVAHTHPEHLHTEQHEKSYLYGPSQADIQYLLSFKDKLREFDGNTNTVSFGLALESYGGWYFDVFDPDQAASSLMDENVQTVLNGLAVVIKQMIDDESHEPKHVFAAIDTFVKAYEELGVKVRFTTYDEMDSEPECAGPYYDPEAQVEPPR